MRQALVIVAILCVGPSAWAQQVTPYPLDEGGWLTGSLRDLQGLFDINSVAGKAPEGQRFTDHLDGL